MDTTNIYTIIDIKARSIYFIHILDKYPECVQLYVSKVESDPKGLFSIATTPMCRGGRYSIPKIDLYHNAEC